jgi:hypothetical protein
MKSRGKAAEKAMENNTNELRSTSPKCWKVFCVKQAEIRVIDRHRHLVHLISTTIKGIPHVEEMLLHNTDQVKFLSDLWHYLNSENGWKAYKSLKREEKKDACKRSMYNDGRK